MGKKLYVGNVVFGASQAELEEHFSSAGSVDSVKIITDRETGRSKGFAFIEMSSSEEASAAIEKLNGADFQGRQLRVDLAKDNANKRSFNR